MRNSSWTIGAVVACSWIYWIYLGLTTDMSIAQDALCYRGLGQQIFEHGFFPAYFIDGPNREPAYPLLVSISMHLGQSSGIDFTKIMAVFGIVFLGITQLLIWALLRRLQIRPAVCAVTLGYFGFSPAVLNAAFSLYSEIAAFPLIVGLVLMSMNFAQNIHAKDQRVMLLSAVGLGLSFFVITMVKGIFEFIFILFMLFYAVWAATHFFQKRKETAWCFVLAILACIAAFQLPLAAYKSINLKYNHTYAVTNRGSWALYASCARRAMPLTQERILTALAYVPGKGFCERIFGEDKCYFWGIETLDHIGLSKAKEVNEQFPKNVFDKEMTSLAFAKIQEAPLSFIFGMTLDGIKMFFWESTKIGFVSYPAWLTKVYDTPAFKDGLRAIISLLSLAGFIFLGIFFSQRVWKTFKAKNAAAADTGRIIIFLMILYFVGFYALFDTIPRFALPIAPLMITAIGILLERTTRTHEHQENIPK